MILHKRPFDQTHSSYDFRNVLKTMDGFILDVLLRDVLKKKLTGTVLCVRPKFQLH